MVNRRWDGWVGVACSPGAYIGQGEADNTQANKHKKNKEIIGKIEKLSNKKDLIERVV